MRWPTRRRPDRILFAAVLAGLAACGDGGSTVVPPPPAAVASLDLTAANTEPPVGTAVPVTVHARDASGSPVAGVRIEFAVGASSGSVSPASRTTDASGAASATWTVATVPGQQTLTAQSAGVSKNLTVSAVPGPPAAVVAEGETEIVSDVGAVLRDAGAVVARDRYGNPTPDVEVAFRVVAGGGSATPAAGRTDAAGRASTAWRMGAAPGENRLNVVVDDLEAVTFVAIAVGDGLAILRAAQEQWPKTDEIALEGRRMELISDALVTVDGAPPAEIVVLDSVRAVIRQAPLPAARAAGCAMERQGQLVVLARSTAFEAEVKRRHGPVVALQQGEERRFEGNEMCLRVAGNRGNRYVLAAVDRAYIDDARFVSEEWHYRGGAPFRMRLADSTSGAQARHRIRARSAAPAHDWATRRPDHVRVHQPGAYAVQGDVYGRSRPYVVGEEFEWYTGDDREGIFRVMALYPPNVVLAVFKDDLPSLWSDTRALAMDSLFLALGSREVQALYEASFGEGPAETSAETGQMLVMFHDGDPSDATGLTYSASNYRQSTVHFRRNPYWDDNSWYYSLVAHELGHAWQFRAIGRVSAVWSGEGIANWIAEERLRQAVGLDLDANHNAGVELQGWPLRLPETGDFVAGYRESHSFLRFLVTQLVLDHGQSYADAARRVVVGASEGWHGRYFTAYDSIGYDEDGGLTNRMREVADEWDAVDARLDWMISFALDDRSSLGRYRIPFVQGASRHFGPYHQFRLGSGASVSEDFAGGGNYYFELLGSGALHILANDGDALADGPRMAWKLVRYR